MMDPIQALAQAQPLKETLFPPTSRYHRIDTATMVLPNGRMVTYLRRRIVPQAERFVLLQEHTVTDGDRVDNLAALYLGDPEQFWRICDANGVLKPDDVTATPGQRIRITLPEGISGVVTGGTGG
jgi:hypothetical protein